MTHSKNEQQKTICLLSQLLSKATVTSCSFLIKVVQCVHFVDDALKPAMPLNDGVIILMLQVCPTQ